MEAEKTSYRPFKFLDRMEGNNHIVLLYDNPKYADLIMARYISNGLKKGESCIFFSPDNPEQVRKRLSAQGIVVDSIRIFQVEGDNGNRSDALSLLKTIMNEAARGRKAPTVVASPPNRNGGGLLTNTGMV